MPIARTWYASFGVSGCGSLIIATLIGTGRGITGFATNDVSRRPGGGARPGTRTPTAGFGAPAGFAPAAVSLGGGPALTIGTGDESGAITAKLAAVSACVGSTGLSKATCSVSESDALTSRILGGTVSCVKITR